MLNSADIRSKRIGDRESRSACLHHVSQLHITWSPFSSMLTSKFTLKSPKLNGSKTGKPSSFILQSSFYIRHRDIYHISHDKRIANIFGHGRVSNYVPRARSCSPGYEQSCFGAAARPGQCSVVAHSCWLVSGFERWVVGFRLLQDGEGDGSWCHGKYFVAVGHKPLISLRRERKREGKDSEFNEEM